MSRFRGIVAAAAVLAACAPSGITGPALPKTTPALKPQRPTKRRKGRLYTLTVSRLEVPAYLQEDRKRAAVEKRERKNQQRLWAGGRR